MLFTLNIGDKVVHTQYGPGEVVEVTPRSDGDQIVEIKFDEETTTKKFIGSILETRFLISEKEILSDIGFSEIAVYHGRKPDFVKINSLCQEKKDGLYQNHHTMVSGAYGENAPHDLGKYEAGRFDARVA